MDVPYHIPVLLNESIHGLNIRKDGTYVDVTFGGGGHSRKILEHLGQSGRLIALDQDEDSSQNLPDDPRFEFVQGNFEYLAQFLRERKVKQVDGILADLGISSHQIDLPERGFSIRFDGPLDMRMNRSANLTAKDVIHTYSEEELTRILRTYGELRNASGIARALVKEREVSEIATVQDLMKCTERWAPKGKDFRFYAQVFQAIRIEVNHELGVLQKFLQKATQLIRPEGRLVVISYHSLEDRMVKNFMRSGNVEGRMEKSLYGHVLRPFKPVGSKAIKASEKEIRNNNRARSARLRIAERLYDHDRST